MDADPVIFGDVVGPKAAVTDNALVRWNGTSGKSVQNSGVTLDDDQCIGNVGCINWDTTPASIAAVEAKMFWNDDDGTLNLGLKGGNVNLQVGQEHVMRAKATEAISNGDIVYISGGDGANPTVTKGDASALSTTTVIGVATEDIALNQFGYVTTQGLVRDVDTSSDAPGTILWLSDSTPGGYTSTRPTQPSFGVVVGQVIRQHATEGVIYAKIDIIPRLTSLSDVLDTGINSGEGLVWDNAQSLYIPDTSGSSANERTGFVLTSGVPTEVDISVNTGSLLLTLTATASTYDYYVDNYKYTVTGSDGVNWTDVEGSHFFYYDGGTLTHTTTFSRDFLDGSLPLVAYGYWDAVNNKFIPDVTEEMHGHQMSGATHWYEHTYEGTRWKDGLALSDIIADGGGGLDTHAQFGVTSGSFADEDLTFSVSTVASTTGYQVVYLDGATPNLRSVTKAGFPVLLDNDTGGATTAPVYNLNTGGTWSTQPVSNNKFFLCHVFATNSVTDAKRMYCVMGQAEYNSINSARLGAQTEAANIVTVLPLPEQLLVASVIFQYNSGYANAVSSQIRSLAGGEDYVDWRQQGITAAGGTTATDHQSLTNRSVAGTHPILEAPSLADQIIKLADNAGTYDLSITDSDDAEVASISSDGNLSVAGSVNVDDTTDSASISTGALVVDGGIGVAKSATIGVQATVAGLPLVPGIDWTSRISAIDNNWFAVCYGNGLFVAVAYSGTGNRVMTSPDGVAWTTRTSAADNQWLSVCYGNDLFVAVASTGTGNRVMTSPDGVTWTTRTSAADNSWRSVCYANGLFVAVSSTGTGNRVMTSPDGITWTIRTSAADNDWRSVCYANSLFVAVADTGTGNRVMTSPDGITWTIRTSAADNQWRSVRYGNGLFVAVASSGTGNRVMTSPDGITWTIRTSAADNGWRSVCYGNGLFVAVANSGIGNRVMTSPDGTTWTTRTSATDNSWRSVCYGNGLFAAVADTGTGDRAMTSGFQRDPLFGLGLEA